MRERISKRQTGRNNPARKEVKIKINKSGLNADGEQRFSLAARFADDSYKKISDTGYMVVEIDRELKRIYFLLQILTMASSLQAPSRKTTRASLLLFRTTRTGKKHRAATSC